MKHRHLNHGAWTLAAIDSCISRGSPEDWAELREAARQDRTLLTKVLHLCTTRLEQAARTGDVEFYDRALYEEWKAWAAAAVGGGGT
jgi:hypothetical protein